MYQKSSNYIVTYRVALGKYDIELTASIQTVKSSENGFKNTVKDMKAV
jgi:hypothetical protein